MKSWQTDQISEGAKVQVLVKSVVGRFEGLVASRFNRGRYRTLRALQDFLRQAGEITNLRPLALSIEKKVAEATGAEEVRLLVPSANGLAFTPISVTKWRSSNCPSLSASSPIVTWLRVHDDPLVWDQLIAEPGFLPLSPAELSALNNISTSLLVPLRHRQELAGILLVASKRSGVPYRTEDIKLLRSVAKQMALWVSNAGLFNQLSYQRRRLERLLGLAVDAREDERKRIALELHDSSVQWLTSAVYHLEACRGLFRKVRHPEAEKELEQVHEVLNRALDDLRHTASDLSPPPPALEKVGLVKALARYLSDFESDTRITTSVSEHGEVPRLSAQVELAAYRIVQEALSNVRKHSKASYVQLNLGLHDGTFWATIADDGVGFEFDESWSNGNGHLGLAGMEERAHMLGGTLGIQSTLGSGTQITLLIPSCEPPVGSEEIPVKRRRADLRPAVSGSEVIR